jgi:periplasmic protein TonB
MRGTWLAASALLHAGVLWALVQLDGGVTLVVIDDDSGVIVFEPVGHVDTPTPKSTPESTPKPDSAPEPPGRPRPTTPIDVDPRPRAPVGGVDVGETGPARSPRRLGLTLSNAPAGPAGPPGQGGEANDAKSGVAHPPPATVCDEPPIKPRAIERVEIEYPAAARAAGVEGRLVLQATVDTNGKVRDVIVVEPVGPEIDEPAQAAFKRWRFEPATRCGVPVAAAYTIAREFRLGD